MDELGRFIMWLAIVMIFGMFMASCRMGKEPDLTQQQLEEIVIKKLNQTVKQDYVIHCFSCEYLGNWSLIAKYAIEVKYSIGTILVTEFCYIDAGDKAVIYSKFRR